MERYFAPAVAGRKRKVPCATAPGGASPGASPRGESAPPPAGGTSSDLSPAVHAESPRPVPPEDLVGALPEWLRERLNVMKAGSGRGPGGGFVLYWMRAALRGHENPALSAAVLAANLLRRPLLVYLSLDGTGPSQTARRHMFSLEGMRDAAREVGALGVQTAVHVARPGRMSPYHLTLAHRAALVVVEEPFVEPHLAAARQVASGSFAAPVWAVDAACVVPARLTSMTSCARAYSYERATAGLREARLTRRYPEVAPYHLANERPGDDPTSPHHIKVPFEPLDLETACLSDVVAACAVDHGVPPVAHTEGGSRAGYRRWRTFRFPPPAPSPVARDGPLGRDGRLGRYHRTRNDAMLPDGSSRMSAYLNLGMVSPLRVAREAAAAPAGPGRAKFVQELLIWRELSYAFVFHHASDYLSVSCLPSWARATLAQHEGDQRAGGAGGRPYTLEELARGETGAAVWDAAQRTLVATGELHNNLRMTWGKAVVAWSASAGEAYERLVHLNDHYALDGQAPPSYAGLLWCLGCFDSPKPEGRVLGKVRARPLASCRYDPPALLRAAERRRVLHNDYAAWKPLWDGYCEFYGASVPDDVTRHTWSRLCDPDDDAVLGLVAVRGEGGEGECPSGRLVGFATAVVHPTTFSQSNDVYLEDLFVAPSARGAGAGAALIEAVKAEAGHAGARRVYWHTQEGNTTARRLYDRVGKLSDFVRYTAEPSPP